LRDLPDAVTTFTNEASLLLTAWGRAITFEKERAPSASAVWILSPMANSEKSMVAPDSRVTESSPEKHTSSEEEEEEEAHCPLSEVPSPLSVHIATVHAYGPRIATGA